MNDEYFLVCQYLKRFLLFGGFVFELLSNVLNKFNIISAAGLWGINVSDEHFLLRGRVVFGDVFLCIPNIAQFRILIMS